MVENNTEFKAQFRAQLLGVLMTELFVKQHKEIKEEIAVLVDKNGLGTSPRAHAFRYKNKPYMKEGYPMYTPKIELLPEHHEKMDSILHRQQYIELDYIRIDAYLTRAMNICKTVSDLYKVIPEQLHKFFPSSVVNHRNGGTSPNMLSYDMVEKFHKENAESHAVLMSRLLSLIIMK